MKKYHNLRHALGLDRDAVDLEFLRKLNEYMDPPAKLGELLAMECCDEPSKRKACILLPVALELLDRPPQGPKTCPRRAKYAITCAVMTVVLVLAAVALVLFLTTKQGMREGLCQIADFAQANCHVDGGCAFLVQIVEVDTVNMIEPWTPQSAYSYAKERTAWMGDPFRCCDDGNIFSVRSSCCSLYEDGAGGFCDNWPERSDANGKRCWSGPWPCLYTLHTLNGAWIVKELRYYERPPLGPLLGAAVALLALLILFWVEDARRARCGARQSKQPKQPKLTSSPVPSPLASRKNSKEARRQNTKESAPPPRQQSKVSQAPSSVVEVAVPASTVVVASPQPEPGQTAAAAPRDAKAPPRCIDPAVLEQQRRPIIEPRGARRQQLSPRPPQLGASRRTVSSIPLHGGLARPPSATNIPRPHGGVSQLQLATTLS